MLNTALLALLLRRSEVLGTCSGSLINSTHLKLNCHLVTTPRECSIWINKLCQDVQLEAMVVEIVYCSNNLVQGLLHQVRTHTPLDCELTLALEQEFSEHDGFTLCLRLPLHVIEPIVLVEALLSRCFVY